ncbi:hypothetical protein Ntsu_09100 [Nocardia sp. IFM 10818]
MIGQQRRGIGQRGNQLRGGADEGARGDRGSGGDLHAVGGGGFGAVPTASGGASTAGTRITKQVHN